MGQKKMFTIYWVCSCVGLCQSHKTVLARTLMMIKDQTTFTPKSERQAALQHRIQCKKIFCKLKWTEANTKAEWGHDSSWAAESEWQAKIEEKAEVESETEVETDTDTETKKGKGKGAVGQT